MNAKSFVHEGLPFAAVPGQRVPGLPDWHIIRADTGAHVSLAYPDGDGALFDDRHTGYRLDADGSVTPFKEKADYWKARRAAGWPGRRRRVPA